MIHQITRTLSPLCLFGYGVLCGGALATKNTDRPMWYTWVLVGVLAASVVQLVLYLIEKSRETAAARMA